MNGSPTVVRRLGATTAALLVVASMIGTGVFTTTGFLVRDLDSAGGVLVAWALGGLLAACSALAYAELSTALPQNGGEYQLLSRIYHPAVGFVAGWISLVVGFSAPMAAAAVAFGNYAQNLVPTPDPRVAALALISLFGLVHMLRVAWGGLVQSLATVLDVLAIVAFGIGALTSEAGVGFGQGTRTLRDAVFSSEFAVGLVYVSFSYSGWNAAIYIAGELEAPERTLPKSLLLGTLLVIVLYLGLNLVFVSSAPFTTLSGVVDVAHVAAVHLFGSGAAKVASLLISLGLMTTVSALLMSGPRVYEAMGRDHARLRWFAEGRTKERGPVRAIAFQMGIAIALVLTMSFELLLTYVGLCLLLSSALAVGGVLVLRLREPELHRPYRMWGYPWTMAAALLLSVWALVHATWQRPTAAAVSAATLLLGYVAYLWARKAPRSLTALRKPPARGSNTGDDEQQQNGQR
jgi:APA family basic amino acid/polyamine antiporter